MTGKNYTKRTISVKISPVGNLFAVSGATPKNTILKQHAPLLLLVPCRIAA